MSLTQSSFKMKHKKPETNDQTTEWQNELVTSVGYELQNYIFLQVSCKNFPISFYIASALHKWFFSLRAPWMIYDFLTPHPTRLHKEQRKTSNWAKFKKKKLFQKVDFILGSVRGTFSAYRKSPSFLCAPRICKYPPDFLWLLPAHYHRLSVWPPVKSWNV